MKGLACVLVVLAMCSGPSFKVLADDRRQPAQDGPDFNEVLTWPGQWVAGHLGEPGLPLPSNTHGVFSSSSSGPQGFKGAVGQFNNNGVIGVVDENGNIRTINSPFATAPASARTSWWGCWPFWRNCNGIAVTSGDGGNFAAAGTSIGRKLAGWGGWHGGRGFEGGRGFGGFGERRGFGGFGERRGFGGFGDRRGFGGNGFSGRKMLGVDFKGREGSENRR